MRPRLAFVALAALAITSCGGLASASTSPFQQLQQRPMQLPKLQAGSCPVTPHVPDKDLDAAFHGLHGQGPVYAGGEGLGDGRIPAAQLVEIVWTASADYSGPILIRGRELDGSGHLYMSARNWWRGPQLKDVEVNSGKEGAGPIVLTVAGMPLYTELELPAAGSLQPFEPAGASPPTDGHVRDWFARVFVSYHGCYGWQVDGLGFSEEIIFEAI